MKKPKILYVSPNTLLGGGEINQLLLASNLDKTIFDVEVAVSAEGPYARQLRERGIRVSIVPMLPLRFRSRSSPSPLSSLRLYLHVLGSKPSIIHSTSLPEDHHSAIAGWLAGVPVIHDAQTIMNRTMLLDRWRASASAKIICISRAIRNSIIELGIPDRNMEIIYSGIDPHSVSSADGHRVRQELGLAGKRVIGIASRLSPEKGQEHFLRAAASLKERFPEVRFMVAGGALYAPMDYEKKLHALAKTLNIEDRVIFTGFRLDALSVIAAMDILVCAADEEALGRVVIEAMALGKPVIATRAGGPCETVIDGETGLLIPPKDAAALAEAIEKLLTDPAATVEMGNKAKIRADNHFALAENIRKVENVYFRILENQTPRPRI